MERWEYYAGIHYASIKNPGVAAYVKGRWPDWKCPELAPQTLIPELNELGAGGWELVSMQPVAEVGGKGDVFFKETVRWGSNAYFCVFKRRVEATTGAGVKG